LDSNINFDLREAGIDMLQFCELFGGGMWQIESLFNDAIEEPENASNFKLLGLAKFSEHAVSCQHDRLEPD
jgi:hypothetical protein